ncbi:hypothetical protein [Brevibacterium sp. VCM10]|uniref:hypothetical protein n=1 Tax=Brevibacterium sp. VCM10 TaxID=1381751 RepID=UPI0004BC02F6|nr:hypothetical protein [Brevibacterium sp. VCM10]
MINNTASLNTIEKWQYQKILENGAIPDDFLIESQLERWNETHHRKLQDDEKQFILRLSESCPSRYELANLLHKYHLASNSVRAMQKQSSDTMGYLDAKFVVATGFDGTTPRTVIGDTSITTSPTNHAVSCSQDPEQEKARPSQISRSAIVWIPSGASQLIAMTANLISARLIVPIFGDFRVLTRAIAEYFTLTDLLALFQVKDFTVEVGPDSDASGRKMILVNTTPLSEGPETDCLDILEIAMLSFEIGHEVGHIFHGHFYERPWIDAHCFRSNPADSLDYLTKVEINADTAGLNTIWDGLKATTGVPIDISWLGAILPLAAHAGMAALCSSESDDARTTYNNWLQRLHYSLKSMYQTLHGTRTEPWRSIPIIKAAPLLAAALYEFYRVGGDNTLQQSTGGLTGEELYDEFKPLCEDYLGLFDR